MPRRTPQPTAHRAATLERRHWPCVLTHSPQVTFATILQVVSNYFMYEEFTSIPAAPRRRPGWEWGGCRACACVSICVGEWVGAESGREGVGARLPGGAGEGADSRSSE